MNLEAFISSEQRDSVRSAIESAEKRTSGEIRVHIESKTSLDAFQRGLEVFAFLNMDQTKLKNGVLFYLAYESKTFAIVADKGINDLVPKDFWNAISMKMSDLFKAGQFSDGLILGIHEAGEKLAAYFPFDNDTDKNELSDDISFGK